MPGALGVFRCTPGMHVCVEFSMGKFFRHAGETFCGERRIIDLDAWGEPSEVGRYWDAKRNLHSLIYCVKCWGLRAESSGVR